MPGTLEFWLLESGPCRKSAELRGFPAEPRVVSTTAATCLTHRNPAVTHHPTGQERPGCGQHRIDPGQAGWPSPRHAPPRRAPAPPAWARLTRSLARHVLARLPSCCWAGRRGGRWAVISPRLPEQVLTLPLLHHTVTATLTTTN